MVSDKDQLKQALHEAQGRLGTPLMPSTPDLVIDSLPDASDLVILSGLNNELSVAKLRELRPLAVEVLSEAGICSCGTRRTSVGRCPCCSLLWPDSLPRYQISRGC